MNIIWIEFIIIWIFMIVFQLMADVVLLRYRKMDAAWPTPQLFSCLDSKPKIYTTSHPKHRHNLIYKL